MLQPKYHLEKTTNKQPLDAFWLYLHGKKHGNILPRRSDLSPVDFSALLGWVVILDVLGHDYAFRLFGSALSRHCAIDLTGKTLESKMPLPFDTNFIGACDTAVKQREILRFTSECTELHHAPVPCEIVMCPLSENGTDIDKIIAAIWPIA